MGQAHHAQVPRRPRPGLHEVVAGRPGLQRHHPPQQARPLGLAKRQDPESQRAYGDRLLHSRKGVRRYQIARSRR
ncbi:hypothetical protein BDFB_006494 [Asbolus verrucosus]|uniref:Uncharacterized protein n=1 Tax=Asbolus verrucosus TaxID=1661398 RepID=A0A482W020_ASBVE|nr:hypothetical protein BDFB_006494 [Asbolus verrucosus]